MATASGTTEHHVDRHLFKESHRFSFFQIVQLLERCYRPEARVGRNGPASQEVIRFMPSASLAFPAADVADVEHIREGEEGGSRFRVTTTFMGLYGTTSPLPVFFSEEILWQEENNSVRAFIDIFHHRLLSLFYRCWLKYRYHVQFEPGGNDDFSRRIFGLIGIGTAGLTDNTGLPSVHLLRYAGFFSQQIRSAPALEGILSDFFEGINVRVEPFTGRWAAIIPPQKSALGIRNCRLNTDCNIGDSVFSRAGSFKIIAGPLSFNTFVSFLPGRENFKTIVSLVKFFIRDRLMFDIKLLIRERDIFRMQLISDSQMQCTQLGWTSWLFSQQSDQIVERNLTLKGSS